MNVTLRPEEEKDYNLVENLTREAFWNIYKPGCDEHLLVHNIRNKKEFIKSLIMWRFLMMKLSVILYMQKPKL